MTNGAKGNTGPQFGTGPLITSAVLVGAGTFIVLAGLAVGGSHLLFGYPALGEGDGSAAGRPGEAEVCAGQSRGFGRCGGMAERAPGSFRERFLTFQLLGVAPFRRPSN